MHRLFVAIRPPADIRARLLSLMGGVAGARWQDDDQLHITLRFVGGADTHQADDLAAALGTVRFAPFALSLSGLGQFERKGRVDTLWAGVEPRDILTQLHRKIDRACGRAGFAADDRAYLPHITLARFSRTGGGPTDTFLASHAGLSTPPFLIDKFILFESRLTQSGARYDIAVVYPADLPAI
ncbi:MULTISPECIES: RNA 2',3'-cyclic phosphodiesterase [Sphingobium]|uniref:RNA 2',3'-cyclic phosphodiesterase n=1 Tax=Sphingobium tyrosinilyticum TaxID=2715436 RepID=A0ABV9F3F6_9SPHN|nr:RNA 2',3'-cyclic phosphodiesterase [Sphingobium sp. EP60837]